MWHHRLITLLACRDAARPEVAPSLPLQAMANPEHDNYGRMASAVEQVILDVQGLSLQAWQSCDWIWHRSCTSAGERTTHSLRPCTYLPRRGSSRITSSRCAGFSRSDITCAAPVARHQPFQLK